MADFQQNGNIAQFHNLRSRPLEELVYELETFSQSRRISLILPSLYSELEGDAQAMELRRLADAAALAAKNGIEVHAGHGITFDNVAPIAAIPQVRELNIGHFLIGEAIFTGLGEAVRAMRTAMDAAR